MSRYFVDDAPVAIPDPNGSGSTIIIKPRMDVATRDKARSEMRSGLLGDETALLLHNIVAWSGPDFDGIPCDREHILQLDPRDPHIDLVLSELGTRNRRRDSPDPKLISVNGVSSAG